MTALIKKKKKDLVVSFSGGKTSAFMSAWLIENYSHKYRFHFIFANTGREHEETLRFVDACDKHFGMNLVWIEAVTDPRQGFGTRHKIVNFETASRNGEPFEAFIAKEGIPNTSRAHCTSRLKTRAIRDWMKENGLIDAPTALGMRADEPKRANPESKSAIEFNLVYPLAHWHPDGITKQDVNDYWEEMPFTLNIPEHYGNCLTCFKKSDNKLMLIAKEQPQWFAWNVEMENRYRHVNAAEGSEHKWWRKQRDTAQLLAVADIVDPEMLIMLTRSEPDASGGCGDECRAFNVEDEEDEPPMIVKKKKALPPPAPVKKKKVLPTAPVKKKKPAEPELIPAVNVAPGHALLSPSYSKTWLNCAAALAAGLDEPNVSGAAALEGTMCHQVLENVINRLIDPEREISPAPANSGQAAVDYIGVAPLSSHPKMTFTADQAELITPFIDYVRGLMDAGYTVFPEMRVDLSAVLGAPNTFGTADLIAFKDDHLIVGDLKMGRHAVSPGTLQELNTQMGLYGAGVLERYRKTKNFQQVTLLIAQPRAGGLKFLDDIPAETIYEFVAYARDRAAAALECVSRGRKALKADDFNPTPAGCEWCRFRDKCSAKLKVVTGQQPKGNEISDAELLAAWQKIPLLKSQIKSTQAEVMKRLLAGRTIGDLKVVAGSQGQRKWADETAAEKYLLGKLYAKAYDKTLITPTAAAKLLKDDPELEQLITRAPGKPSVTTMGDKRKAYEIVEDDDLSD